MKKAKVVPLAPNPKNLDPMNINARLYNQVSQLLTQLENSRTVTMRERVQALIAVGRLQQIFAALRKAAPHDERSGSTVRKYVAAFAPDAVRGRKRGAGGADAEPADDWFEGTDIDTNPDNRGGGAA